MSHPYDGLRRCEECDQKFATAKLIYIPEENGTYVICLACFEGIQDSWDKMQVRELRDLQIVQLPEFLD